MRTLPLLIVLAILSGCNPYSKMVNKAVGLGTTQYQNAIAYKPGDSNKFVPRTVTSGGKLVTVDMYDWVSGFFAGDLWLMYKLTNKPYWKNEAITWTEKLAPVRNYYGHHDVGFMIGSSYGNGYHIGGLKQYDTIMVKAAQSLCKRFSPTVGCIKSWNNGKSWDGVTKWNYPVIIDNMMNLELLFEATQMSGDSSYWKVAISHANTTLKNHFRPDFSSYHVVNYNENTGAVLNKETCQGFTNESAWARGQAWGLYGFTTCYRYTKDDKYLNRAKNIAQYWLSNKDMPSDGIPYWDFNANDTSLKPQWKFDRSKYPAMPRDVAAAAIAASGLIELSRYVERSLKDLYLSAAKRIIASLTQSYLADTSRNRYFILDHSVGSLPHGNEIDAPLCYADYYYLEALVRLKGK